MDGTYSKTRAQALADGDLIDVTEMANKAGIHHPTALTRAVWDECVRVPEGADDQNENGRLWYVLWMFRYAVFIIPPTIVPNIVFFKLLVRNVSSEAKEVSLQAVCGLEDDRPMVITIMQSEW